MINLTKEERKEIAIILQTEQYQGILISEEVITQIASWLKDYESKINDNRMKIDSILYESIKPQGAGTYHNPPIEDDELRTRTL